MSESDEFWDFYWEMRLQDLEGLGKRAAILAISKLIRRLADRPGQRVRLLELGCGEGQIIGALVEAHAAVQSIAASCGVDYAAAAIQKCRQAYPGLSFIEGDFTDPDLLAGLGCFEIVLLVNALHEVFSACYSAELGEVLVPAAKAQVEQALAGAAERLAPGGYLVLFDGLETPGDIGRPLRIRFVDRQARRRFDLFTSQYHPFRISCRESSDPLRVEISWRDFTRYLTKSIFLDKRLWQTERLESYQYFNESEFRSALANLGLSIRELRTLTVNDEKWRNEVEIEDPSLDFPAEHILIVAQKPE